VSLPIPCFFLVGAIGVAFTSFGLVFRTALILRIRFTFAVSASAFFGGVAGWGGSFGLRLATGVRELCILFYSRLVPFYSAVRRRRALAFSRLSLYSLFLPLFHQFGSVFNIGVGVGVGVDVFSSLGRSGVR
jgi:hypothetical protein